MGKVVYLTPTERVVADVAGWIRTVVSRREGRNDSGYYNTKKTRHENDGLAVAGEMAFAKLRREYYDFPLNTFKKPDVAGFQVRATDLKLGGLVVRHEDDPTDTFLLVIVERAQGGGLQCTVVGWIEGREAMRKTYQWRDNFLVPAKFLKEVTC